MRTLLASAATALAMTALMAPAAQAANNPIVRKNNDAGASSTVIQKDEPPLNGVPRDRDNGYPQQNAPQQKQ
jgi:hypothetical protein